MKSSDPSRRQLRLGAAELVAGAVMLVAAVAIGLTRPRLAERFHGIRVAADVYALPSPEQTVVMSLGWRSALADLIFSTTLVSYGIHIQEKRRFEFVANYLDTVNELDPKFRAPYLYADTVLTLGVVKPREQDYSRARKIVERGMQEFPLDAQLWTQGGQFMAYLAPQAFSDEAVKKEWKLEGARRMARACELVGNNEALPFHCISAATILSKAGEREATIQFLERVLTVVDDPEVRGIALSYLQKTVSESERDRVQWRSERFSDAWRSDLSFVSKGDLLIAGPPLNVARCAGRGGEPDSGCFVTWLDWGMSGGRR